MIDLHASDPSTIDPHPVRPRSRIARLLGRPRSTGESSPFRDGESARAAGREGMWLLLASLGMLFAATVLAAVILRVQIETWPSDLPGLPGLLWISTPRLLLSSLTMQSAVRATRADRARPAARLLLVTLSLGLVFLMLQLVAWVQWLEVVDARWVESTSHRFAVAGFYVLTGLHGLHVVGGLVPLAVLAVRGRLGRIGAGRSSAVEQTAMYWHFLDGVWIVLFALLVLVL